MSVTTDITPIVEKHPGAGRDALIPILQEVQEAHGYISREAAARIGSHLGLATSKIYGVATFYNQFRFNPPGRNQIQVCRGTACHVKNSRAVAECLERELGIRDGQTTRDGLFSLEVVACLGACGQAPVVCINGEFHGNMDNKKIQRVLKKLRREAREEADVK